LASCGVDGFVIVWSGATFGILKHLIYIFVNYIIKFVYILEQITKINQHSDFVKGVTWDPAGKFLASQVHDGF
jgi:protein HIRA/HIR1